MSSSTLPVWIQYMQAIGPTCVALIAAFIASIIQYRQWKLAHDKVRLDLFERRITVYEAITSEVFVGDGDTRKQVQRISDVVAKMAGYRFLFPADLTEMIAKAELTLMIISARCNSIGVNDLHAEVMGYFRRYQEEVDAFKKSADRHLRFEH